MHNIVLDLDETLIHYTPEEEAKKLLETHPTFYKPLYFTITFKEDTLHFFKRPFLEDFLKFCFQRFESVSIWTAAIEEYANLVVAELFRDLPSPTHVWHRGMCTPIGTSYTKSLDVFSRKTGIPLSETWLLDDNSTTCAANGDRALPITAWEPRINTHGSDIALAVLQTLFVV